MVVVVSPPADLPAEALSLFTTTDPFLSNTPIFIFYGPAATTTSTSSSSRIQAHVFAAPGLHSYSRLTVSPGSPLYAAVNGLPREEQGDEICRGLAFSIYKYFLDIPGEVKATWAEHLFSTRKPPSAFDLFGDTHAALLASRMHKVENAREVANDIRLSLARQSVPWIDVDLTLPSGAMQKPDEGDKPGVEDADEDCTATRYGSFAELVRVFGEPTFIPTSKLRRAPSRPTAINRTMSFSRKQKENLRREMCELVDTEESYVGKLNELVHDVAANFRLKAKNKASTSSSPNAESLKRLFPPSLDDILQTNSDFLRAIGSILEETENGAIADIDASSDDTPKPFIPSDSKQGDVTGVAAFAKCLLEWIPKFADCYRAYMQAHVDFSQILRTFTKDTGSSFSKRVQETGEQRLTSMLIEPIQRLPRYNLYIDNIVKQLPVRHPSVKHLLKARDIITEICSGDDASNVQSRTIGRLQVLVPSWPEDFCPTGRFIAAIDVIELSPPYHLVNSREGSGIILLFADKLVLLSKTSVSAMTARGLLAEIEKPGTNTLTRSGRPRTPQNLDFLQQMDLSHATLTELEGGSTVQLLYPRIPLNVDDKTSLNRMASRAFFLTGNYENKAIRFIEEFVKARVEGYYPETERESYKWEARSTQEKTDNINFFTAITEQPSLVNAVPRRDCSRVKIRVDSVKKDILDVDKKNVDVFVYIVPAGDGIYRVEIHSIDEAPARSHVKATDLLPLLQKKVTTVLQLSNAITNPEITACLLTRNEQLLRVLQSLHVVRDDQPPESLELGRERTNSVRTPSPVKLLSSFFGSGVKDVPTPRRLQRPLPALGEIPRMAPPVPASKPASRPPSRPATQDSSKSFDDTASKASIPLSATSGASDSLLRLEETLAAYVLALHARKGNVVGKTLRSRSMADELAVNELYNNLVENPDNHQVAAQCSVDVLFASFEKFVRTAWADKMGSIVPIETMAEIQSKSDSMFPVDFEDYFRSTFFRLSPQNQRAFKGLVRLLADLLDGTGNDSDRGILTMAFAEVLVPEGEPQDYISLMDRFIDDIDTLFEDSFDSGAATPHGGSMTSQRRDRLANVSSVSSNTSSLKRRFGLGHLSRENSKSEHDNKVGSVWRQLSKTARNNNSQPSSLSRGSLVRSRSTDVDVRASPPRRPVSRDRPTVLGAFSFEDAQSRSPFLQGSPLGTIGEVGSPQPNGLNDGPRKKRRSSLSDLKTLQENSPASWTPRTPGSNGTVIRRQTSLQPSPMTPSPTKIPTASSPLTRLPSPPKDGSPTMARHHLTTRERPVPVRQDTGESRARSPPKRRNESVSGIPMLRPSSSHAPAALVERPSSGNSNKVPPQQQTPATSPTKPSPQTPGASPTKLPSAASSPLKLPVSTANTTSPKKLRMQSPQKLRERLQNEQKAISSTSTSLETELSLLRAEMDALSTKPTQAPRNTRLPRIPSAASPTPPDAKSPPTQTSPSLTSITTRLTTLESNHTSNFTTLTSRLDALSNDVSTSLSISESKARKLDDLYKEANAENEALYARFNEELAKVLKGVKGDGVVELKRKLQEAQEEAAKGKREVARLRREVVGLRAQLKDG
ncbi:MAG: hypothetical protein M1820_000924 [Bogoriella megaspora]|nr:MAG: hypothetical protein M1820_000924 [Bogoriella megaspora]